MNKKAKVLLIISGCLLCLGLLLCGLSYAMGFHGQFGVTSDGEYIDFSETDIEPQKIPIEAFTVIDIDGVTGNIRLIPSDGYYIEYGGNVSHSVENGVLTVRGTKENDSWYLIRAERRLPFFYIGDSSDIGSIKIYYPDSAAFDVINAVSGYGDVSVTGVTCNELTAASDSGDVYVSRSSASVSTITSDYGDVYVKNLTGDSSTISLLAGDIELDVVEMSLGLTVNNDYGDIEAKGMAAGEITVTNNSGDVSIEGFYAANSLSVNADFGDVELSAPDGGVGAYNFDLSTDLGEVEFMGQNCGSAAAIDAGADRTVTVRSSYGDVEVE